MLHSSLHIPWLDHSPGLWVADLGPVLKVDHGARSQLMDAPLIDTPYGQC